MARAGRKRKQGKRHPSGQLVRTPKNDKGTPELQLQRMKRIGAVPAASEQLWLSKGAEAAIAGTIPTKADRKRGATGGVAPLKMTDADESFDPLGRAWAAGLLDNVQGITPEDLRDAGRRFTALYWRKLPAGSVVSGLYANMVAGLVEELPAGVSREQLVEDADARDQRQEAALNRILAGLNGLGRDVRKATDELTLDPFADAGPAWLDWLVAARGSALPGLAGAISRKMTVGQVMMPTGVVDPHDCTVGMVMPAPDARRAAQPVGPDDWALFLPAAMQLRLSMHLATLAKALEGLQLIYRGGRLTSA